MRIIKNDSQSLLTLKEQLLIKNITDPFCLNTITIQTHFSPDDIDTLKNIATSGNLIKIETINITSWYNPEFKDEDIQLFLEALFSSPKPFNHLNHINIKYINTNDTNITPLLKAIQEQKLPNLTKLDLGSNNLSKSMGSTLISALDINCSSLFYLDLGISEDVDLIVKLAKMPNVLANIHRPSSSLLYRYLKIFNQLSSSENDYQLAKLTSMGLIDLSEEHNKEAVKYILDNADKYHAKIDNIGYYGTSMMHYFHEDKDMLEYLFKKGFAPDRSSLYFLKQFSEDTQNSHATIMNKKKDWFLKQCNNFTPEEIRNTINNFDKEIRGLLDNSTDLLLLISLLNVSIETRKQFFSIALDNNNSTDLVSYYNQLIYNKSPLEYIVYILETAAFSLRNTYLTTNTKGAYTGHAANLYSYYPYPDNKSQSETTTIPNLLTAIKLNYLQASPTALEIKELLVTLCNQNPHLVQYKFAGIAQSNELTERASCYKILENVEIYLVEILFNTISGQNLQQIYQKIQLFKLASAITESYITYGDKDHPACYGGFIARIAACAVDELSPALATLYDDYIGHYILRNNSRLNDDSVITEYNVKAKIQFFIGELINFVNINSYLKNELANFMLNESGPIDLNNIPIDYNIVYAAINQAFFNIYKLIPSFEEYQLIIDNLSANYSLQYYYGFIHDGQNEQFIPQNNIRDLKESGTPVNSASNHLSPSPITILYNLTNPSDITYNFNMTITEVNSSEVSLIARTTNEID